MSDERRCDCCKRYWYVDDLVSGLCPNCLDFLATKNQMNIEQDQKIKELEHRLSNCIELPVKIGNKVYKICPKCNDNHKGSCKNCAWGGCFSGICDVGVGIWSDGSYTESPLQIVEKLVTDQNISNIYDWWNIMFFENEIKAKQSMEEYDQIRIIEDKSERVEKFRHWYNSRKIKNPLKLKEMKNG